MLTAVQGVAAFDHRGPGAFRAWLREILANRTRHYFRARAARRTAGPAGLDGLADPQGPLARRWDREHDAFVAARAMARVRGEFAPATWEAFRRQVLDGEPAAAAAAAPGGDGQRRAHRQEPGAQAAAGRTRRPRRLRAGFVKGSRGPRTLPVSPTAPARKAKAGQVPDESGLAAPTGLPSILTVT